jgi:hypothetical protein
MANQPGCFNRAEDWRHSSKGGALSDLVARDFKAFLKSLKSNSVEYLLICGYPAGLAPQPNAGYSRR